MGDTKIEIKIGEISFSGEGNQDWLSKQLDKILDKASELIKLSTPSAKEENNKPADFSHASDIAKQPLASFLKSKNATTNQPDKFLATAIWLEVKGNSRLKTSDVSAALKQSNQTKLANPADCLNRNVKKGCCEKDGKEFFVTQNGKEAMGF